MTKEYFIEKRPSEGDYAVRKPDSERASGVFPTQGAAIEWAQGQNPDAIHVERVRHTENGGPDKWRKL